mmetsp:Transcript_1705/g.10510  ORF Transcript_1705/g.10510 Transcript_1705/m.10510 type:complete len:284 (-) Transcript_1705:29-880(-)
MEQQTGHACKNPRSHRRWMAGPALHDGQGRLAYCQDISRLVMVLHVLVKYLIRVIQVRQEVSLNGQDRASGPIQPGCSIFFLVQREPKRQHDVLFLRDATMWSIADVIQSDPCRLQAPETLPLGHDSQFHLHGRFGIGHEYECGPVTILPRVGDLVVSTSVPRYQLDACSEVLGWNLAQELHPRIHFRHEYFSSLRQVVELHHPSKHIFSIFVHFPGPLAACEHQPVPRAFWTLGDTCESFCFPFEPPSFASVRRFNLGRSPPPSETPCACREAREVQLRHVC